MQFEARFREPIAAGTVTLTFRRWKLGQAVAGHRYRTAAGRIEVDAVDVVGEESLTSADARRAGYRTARALLDDLRGSPDLPLYRVRFHYVDEPDPRDELARAASLDDEERRTIDRRLARLDRASSHGPWTTSTLALIAASPCVRAGDLAESLGRDKEPFKLDVRKLKNLGLTISLERGYRLSPRGQAYLSVPRAVTPPV